MNSLKLDCLKESPDFFESLELLNKSLKKIKLFINHHDRSRELISALRDLKHILFFMKYISYPKKLLKLKNKTINCCNIFEEVCFRIEHNTLKTNYKISQKSISEVYELCEEVNKLIIEFNNQLL